jgi:hypothetical protein
MTVVIISAYGRFHNNNNNNNLTTLVAITLLSHILFIFPIITIRPKGEARPIRDRPMNSVIASLRSGRASVPPSDCLMVA